MDEEDGDHEEYLEEMDEDSDEEEGEEDDEESEEEEDEEEETGQVQLLSQHPLPASLMPSSGSKGSIITCCPRILGGSSPCNLDRNLPRLSCGHFAVPTRDVAIQGKKKSEKLYSQDNKKSFYGLMSPVVCFI